MAKTLRSSRHQLLQELLIKKRTAAGLTQEALARRLGRPQSFVSKYETGERRLDLVEFLEIAEAVGFDAIAFVRTLRRKA